MRGAMVGGVGYAAGRAGARHSAQEQQQQAPPSAPPAPAAAAPPAETTVEQLQKLGQLRDSGVLSTEEFEAQKQKVLAGG